MPLVVSASFKSVRAVIFMLHEFRQAITTLYGSVAKEYFGAAVSAGDINSDSKDD